MTDRHRYLIVTLERDTRDDDATEIAEAIAMVRGVATCELGDPNTVHDLIQRDVVRRELIREIHDLLVAKKGA